MSPVLRLQFGGSFEGSCEDCFKDSFKDAGSFEASFKDSFAGILLRVPLRQGFLAGCYDYSSRKPASIHLVFDNAPYSAMDGRGGGGSLKTRALGALACIKFYIVAQA